MSRPAIVRLAVLAAFGVSLIMAGPAAAQAGTPALHGSARSTARPDGVVWWFSGYTYPGTSDGYSACVAKGEYERSHGGVSTFSCQLGNPDAGLYGLWLGDII